MKDTNYPAGKKRKLRVRDYARDATWREREKRKGGKGKRIKGGVTRV